MNNWDNAMSGPPPLHLGGINPTSVNPAPIPNPITVRPVLEGPNVRDAPPDGRWSETILVGTATPVKLAAFRLTRQGLLIRNEDISNSIRFGEQSDRVGFSPVQGTLLKGNESIILRASPEVWAIASGGSCQVSVCDEWYSLPHQHQPFGA